MSACKGLPKNDCIKIDKCIFTNGRRQYCRTKKNKKLKNKSSKIINKMSMIQEVPVILHHNDYTTVSYKSLSKTKPTAAFDLDWTIIKTKSGNIFPKNPNDWDWLYKNTKEKLKDLSKTYNILVITNQNGLKTSEKRDNFIIKIINIIKQLSIPIKFYISIKNGFYRKPLTGIWREYCSTINSNDKSFYCGDAAGREKDFAGTDFMFAFNNKITFYLPENIFLNSPDKIALTWPTYLTKYRGVRDNITLNLKEPTLIIMVGFPGSGKSSISKEFNLPIASNDIQGTSAKCKRFVISYLKKQNSCVVDNTNLSTAHRNIYLELAKKHNIKTMIIWVSNDIKFCYYMNQLRCELSKGKQSIISKIAYYKLRKNFVKPDPSESNYFIETQNKVEKYEYLFPDLK